MQYLISLFVVLETAEAVRCAACPGELFCILQLLISLFGELAAHFELQIFVLNRVGPCSHSLFVSLAAQFDADMFSSSSLKSGADRPEY